MQPKPVASDTSAGKTVGTARRCAAAASGPQPSADWTAGSELRVVFQGLLAVPALRRGIRRCLARIEGPSGL